MSTLKNITLSTLPDITDVQDNFNTLNNDKLEVVNIIQGENITLEIDGKNITVSAIGGTDGKNIEMRYNGTYLQYRLIGDLEWINLVQIESTVELSNRVMTLETNQGDLSSVPTALQNKTIAEMITTNFTSVSNGKGLIANAITDKGVETLATDTFQTMADNIGLISGGAPESKGIDEYTKLILHGEDFLDSSFVPKVVTNTGGVIASDGIFSNCINLASGKLEIAMDADFQFEADDFTIDFWIKYASNSVGESTIMSVGQLETSNGVYSDRGFVIGYSNVSNGDLLCYASSNGSQWNIFDMFSMGGIPQLNTWIHFAIVRKGNIFYIFKNGTMINAKISSLPLRINTDKRLLVNRGWKITENRQNIKIDELRVSKGIARWVSDFTPPTSPYEVDNQSYSLYLENQIVESEYQNL